MSVVASSVRRVQKSVVPACARFSTSIEEVEAAADKVKRHRMVVQKSTMPTTFTKVHGPGTDLHIPKNMSEVSVFSGQPEEHKNRTVIIAPRILKTLQSGDLQGYQWQLTWKHNNRWTNPLMGWSSSADPQAQVKLNFDSKEDAVAYAQRNGWKFETRAPTAQANENVEAGRSNYGHNFLRRRVELEMAEARDNGTLNKFAEFNHEGAGQSGWFMQLTYHGEKDVEQYGDAKAPNGRDCLKDTRGQQKQ